MWALVTPEWWWIMAAWLTNKADFCIHVATEIEARREPQDPQDPTPEALTERYGEITDAEPEYRRNGERGDGVYMTHNVKRVELPDGSTKVTGWCDGCDPDNCCGCAHIETPVVPGYEPVEGS